MPRWRNAVRRRPTDCCAACADPAQRGDSAADEAGRRSAGRPASCGLRLPSSRAFGVGGVGCGGWGFVLLPCAGTLPPSSRAFGLGGVGCGGWGFVLLPCVGTLPLVSRAFGLGGVGCGGWEFVLLPCVGTLPPSVEPRGAGLARSRRTAFGTLVFHSLHHSFSRCQHRFFCAAPPTCPGAPRGCCFFPPRADNRPSLRSNRLRRGRIRPSPPANIRSASMWFRHDLPARPVGGRRPGGRDCRA